MAPTDQVATTRKAGQGSREINGVINLKRSRTWLPGHILVLIVQRFSNCWSNSTPDRILWQGGGDRKATWVNFGVHSLQHKFNLHAIIYSNLEWLQCNLAQCNKLHEGREGGELGWRTGEKGGVAAWKRDTTYQAISTHTHTHWDVIGSSFTWRGEVKSKDLISSDIKGQACYDHWIWMF